jgi:FMN phosphatase YigB (HAD superfamily)
MLSKGSRAADTRSRSRRPLAEAIAGFPVITCDVFDTAVVRRLARAEDIPLLTGLRAAAAGLLTCPAAAFREFRLEAERAARRDAIAAGHDEVRLEEICARLAACGVVTDPIALAALEVAVERSLCVPVAAIRSALAARSAGQRLMFLSDTILPGQAVAAVLRDAGYGGAIEVLTSADTRRNKASGRLFAHALEALGVTADTVLHIGDDPVSDIQRARDHGIATFQVTRDWPPPENEAVAQQDPLLRLTHSYRRSRAAPPPADAETLPRYASLLLIGFTLFVLAEARRRGIDRIYFLARDGHIPLALARRLVARSGQAVELHYLEVSRQAITVPALANDLPRLAEVIGDSLLDRPLQTALSFLGIDDTVTAGLLRGIGIDPDVRLTGPAGREPIRRLFAAGQDLIAARLAERREAAMAYLEQSGFLAPGPRLIVDVGWRGSTQKALAALTGLPGADVIGCYIGLWAEALAPDFNPDNAVGYLFGFGHPRHRADIVRDGYVLLELFLSSPAASVSHYVRRDDGTTGPAFTGEPEPGRSIRQQIMFAIETLCLAEFDNLDTLLDGNWPAELDADAGLFDLRGLLAQPTRQQVAAVNRIPFIHGVDGGHSSVAVNPVPLHELVLHPGHALRRIGNSPWRAGAVRASLPWPVPDMSYADFRHRFQRLLALTGRRL